MGDDKKEEWQKTQRFTTDLHNWHGIITNYVDLEKKALSKMEAYRQDLQKTLAEKGFKATWLQDEIIYDDLTDDELKELAVVETQVWARHFKFGLDSGRIAGTEHKLTEEGAKKLLDDWLKCWPEIGTWAAKVRDIETGRPSSNGPPYYWRMRNGHQAELLPSVSEEIEEEKFIKKCDAEKMQLGLVPIGAKASVLTGKTLKGQARWEQCVIREHVTREGHTKVKLTDGFGADFYMPPDTPAAPPRKK